jgi:hypothetical protein
VLHLDDLVKQDSYLGGREDVREMMGLVDARRQVAIGNEAVRISSPQEQTELPEDDEVVGDSDGPAVKGCEPLLNGHLEVNWPAPFEGLCHEAIKSP